MTLRHLKIFSEVCEQESITKAAENLGMTQPTVSIAVKELEVHYNTRLFERMNRKIYLTAQGRELLQYAKNIIQQFEDAENCISKGNSSQVIKIGCNVTYAITELFELLERARGEHPEIEFEIAVANSNQIETRLLKNELDFIIVDNMNVSPQFISKLIRQEIMYPYCGRDLKAKIETPLTLEELSMQPLLLREKGSGSRECVEQVFQLNGYSAQVKMDSLSMTALIQAAAHNLGICFLTESCLKAYNTLDIYPVPLVNNYFLRRYFLIYHKNKHITKEMRQLFTYFTST